MNHHTICRNVDDDASEVAAEKTLTDGSGANLQELYSDPAIYGTTLQTSCNLAEANPRGLMMDS